MAEVTLASASEKQIWQKEYLKEYVRESGFRGFMGKSASSIICTKHQLQNEAGTTINIPLITRLSGNGVSGSSVLDGNEEDIGNYNCPIVVDWRRHGVRVPKSTSYKTEIDLLNAGRDLLRQWEAEQLRDDVIQAMLSAVTSGSTTVNWVDATAANKNSYAAGNEDRLLFGSQVSNYNATMATALATIDTTNDVTDAAMMSLAKRLAKQADPHIRPYRSKIGQEFFVAFHGSRTFRDLKADSTITQANREARPRDVEANPLFQDGDLIYDGVLHREVPEIDGIASTAGFDSVGASSSAVRPIFVCGQQAAGVAWGQMPTPRTDSTKDYAFRPGVAIEELLGVKKMAFNGKQHGMVTVFASAAADS